MTNLQSFKFGFVNSGEIPKSVILVVVDFSFLVKVVKRSELMSMNK